MRSCNNQIVNTNITAAEHQRDMKEMFSRGWHYHSRIFVTNRIGEGIAFISFDTPFHCGLFLRHPSTRTTSSGRAIRTREQALDSPFTATHTLHRHLVPHGTYHKLKYIYWLRATSLFTHDGGWLGMGLLSNWRWHWLVNNVYRGVGLANNAKVNVKRLKWSFFIAIQLVSFPFSSSDVDDSMPFAMNKRGPGYWDYLYMAGYLWRKRFKNNGL